MKKIFFLFFSILLSLVGRAQNCLPGGITFTTQAQIDNFKSNYPGCKVVGQVIIVGTNINNLDSLDEITVISSGFELYNNSALTNLDGLKSLDSVGNQFVISKNNALTDLSGLKNLTAVGELDIWNNAVLPNLDGLEKLRHVTDLLSILANPQLSQINALQQVDSIGGLVIRDNQQLASLHGLENLRYIGAASALGQAGLTDVSVNIELNPLLTNLSGLDSLRTVAGGMVITFNQALSSLAGLGNLRSAGGLNISYTDFLTDLSGLNNLTTIGNKHVTPYGGSLFIFENWGLLNLNGLEKLDSVGGLINIVSNRELLSLQGLTHLRRVGGLWIGGNDKLPGLTGLESLVTIDSTLSLGGILLLTDLTGLSGLTTVGDYLGISGNPNLNSLAGMSSLKSVSQLNISSNEILTSLSGLPPLPSLYSLYLVQNPALLDLQGFDSLQAISAYFYLARNKLLTNLHGLEQLTTIGGDFDVVESPALVSLSGLEHLTVVGRNLSLSQNPALTTLQGLNQLDTVGGYLLITQDSALQNLQGLESLHSVAKEFFIVQNPALSSLSGLTQLQELGHDGYPAYIEANDALPNLTGLDHLSIVSGELNIRNNASLLNLQGLNHLKSVRYNLRIEDNPMLQTLNGLDSLVSVEFGNLEISNNVALSSLSGLQSLSQSGGLLIQNNALLADCAAFVVCNQILNNPAAVTIMNNASGCNTTAEVETYCNSIPVIAEVRVDENGNCQPDASDPPVENIHISLTGAAQMNLRPTDSVGIARFGYLEMGACSLQLPQYPTDKWSVCQQPIVLDPNGSTDTLRATILLSPITQCPELTVDAGLPSNFRGCLVNSDLTISVQNTGTALAEGVKVAVVKPFGLDIVAAVPPFSAQNGDTLYFEVGDVPPFATATVQLTVKTSCANLLIGQTLCVETFAALENACPSTLPAFSEIKLAAKCVGDTLVRFTLKNIGDAPTQNVHTYQIIRNDAVGSAINFSLNAQQSIAVDMPADGATYRMEATNLDDGSLTATALENCGGLTPGQITAFWLDEGLLAHDFDCRQVIGSYDPNQKTAVPTGAGPEHILAANRPLLYTIDFQNTGTDTAFRVLLRDMLDKNLDIESFRPGFASHPYTWEIRGGNWLEVLFLPIMLPDSNVNEAASHGFFSFTIDQKPDLPNGTYLFNTASIIFDFNPPIWTNYVQHFIGQLTVAVDEPQASAGLWQVWGNPTRDQATFQASEFIPGEKRFALFDGSGRPVRVAQFSEQTFDFQRDGLPAGLYFFKISDASGRVFSGKIVVTE